jgi:hypothetical protein
VASHRRRYKESETSLLRYSVEVSALETSGSRFDRSRRLLVSLDRPYGLYPFVQGVRGHAQEVAYFRDGRCPIDNLPDGLVLSSALDR